MTFSLPNDLDNCWNAGIIILFLDGIFGSTSLSYNEQGQHEEDNGSENMIIRGDNLEALKALLPRYEGRVKCIYIDEAVA